MTYIGPTALLCSLFEGFANALVYLINREKNEDYLRFLTHAGETSFPVSLTSI